MSDDLDRMRLWCRDNAAYLDEMGWQRPSMAAARYVKEPGDWQLDRKGSTG